MKDKIEEVFNQLATVYENTIDAEGLYNSEYERPAMLEQIPEDFTGKRVFDAGCAAGWYSFQPLRRGAKVTAADVNPEMVPATKRRIGDQAAVHCLDLTTELPFEDHSFDLIVNSLTQYNINR